MEKSDTTQPLVTKLKTWEAIENEYNTFKSILAKDGIHVGDKINEFIKKFNVEFGDGNPAFSLDHFMDNDSMKAVPAVFRSREDWNAYLYELADKDPQTLQEILWQAQTISSLADKWLRKNV